MNRLEAIRARYGAFVEVNYRPAGGGYTREAAQAERDTAKASAADIPLLLAVAEAAAALRGADAAVTEAYAGEFPGSKTQERARLDADYEYEEAFANLLLAIAPLLEEAE